MSGSWASASTRCACGWTRCNWPPQPHRHRRGQRADGAERRDSRRPAWPATLQTPSRLSRCRCAWWAGCPSPAEFDKIIVKSSANGLVLLKDVGHAEVGAEDYSSVLNTPGARRGHRRRAAHNANALDVDSQAKAALKELSKSFPPGLEYAIAFRLRRPWSATRSAKCW
jgi:multidrug efflux pump subunit AcrB